MFERIRSTFRYWFVGLPYLQQFRTGSKPVSISLENDRRIL